MPRTCGECRFGNEKTGTRPVPEETRQSYRCPYAPIAPERLRPFVRVIVPPAYSGEELTECPGYTSALPEVVEAFRAWRHWEKADVRAFTGGAWPTRALTLGIEAADAAVSAHHRWCADNPAKKD